jgi:ectoine hydroxylase-related dioxygenase (phytanoyl-CoA dioxygenase family)
MKKSIESCVEDLKNNGICILSKYFDNRFCNDAIKEMDHIISKNKHYVHSEINEGASGDERLFKIENQSKFAKIFKNDSFLNAVIKDASEEKLNSYFILGGKLNFDSKVSRNSGGGWHRDGDHSQLKIMVYLNDVKSTNGPFLFIPDSKQFDAERNKIGAKNSLKKRIYIRLGKIKERDPRYLENSIEDYIKKNNLNITEIKGEAGTVVLFDGSFIHRGKIIVEGVRYSYTNYFFKSDLKTKYSKNKQFKKYYLK